MEQFDWKLDYQAVSGTSTYGTLALAAVYRPNTESFGYRKVPKGFRFDRDQRAPVPIGRMRQGFL